MDPLQIKNVYDALAALRHFYEAVDEAVSKLLAEHPGNFTCTLGCTDCCIDGITVFEIEAEHIKRHHSVQQITPISDQKTGCVFLDASGRCRIYPHRPYVCRTQGLPLRWFEDEPDGSMMELRDICPKNDTGPPLEALPESAFWTIGSYEGELARLQKAFGRGRLRRMALRDLFEQPPAP